MWFHKGLDYLDEVRSARDLWAFDLVEHKSQLQDGSVILQISNLSKPI
jgi:16S rRNA (guanine527-N7)-methyltransferase